MRASRPCKRSHGTNARYVAGCSCPDCCAAHAAHKKDYRRRRSEGAAPYRSASEASKHIRMLLDSGMSRADIASASGLSKRTLYMIMDREQTQIQGRTHSAILGVTVDDGGRITAWRIRAMVGHMQSCGFSIPELADKMKVHEKTLRRCLASDRCSIDVHRRASVLFGLMVRSGRIPVSLMEAIS